MVLTKLDPACTIDTCTVCGGGEFKFLFAKHGWRIEQCRTCGFVFVNPRYTEAQADTIYNQADWFFSGRDGDGKKNYADEELASAQRAEKAIGQIRKFKDGAGLKLLDVGCGLGYVLDAGKKAGFDVSGIDISAQGVAICRQKGHAAETGVLKTTALGSGQRYDIITAFDVFEHICDPLAFLDGLKKIANPDALVVLAVPNVRCFAARLRGQGWSQFILPEHLNYFCSATIRQILERCGFRVLEIYSEPSIALGLRPFLRRAFGKTIFKGVASALVNLITRFKRYVFYPPINWYVKKAQLEGNLLVVFASAGNGSPASPASGPVA